MSDMRGRANTRRLQVGTHAGTPPRLFEVQPEHWRLTGEQRRHEWFRLVITGVLTAGWYWSAWHVISTFFAALALGSAVSLLGDRLREDTAALRWLVALDAAKYWLAAAYVSYLLVHGDVGIDMPKSIGFAVLIGLAFLGVATTFPVRTRVGGLMLTVVVAGAIVSVASWGMS